MNYFVYIIKTRPGYYKKTYVGYTNNLKKRLLAHNKSLGAKSTKGYKWSIVFKKRFSSKSEAMSYEYYLKKNYYLRKKILQKKYKNSLF